MGLVNMTKMFEGGIIALLNDVWLRLGFILWGWANENMFRTIHLPKFKKYVKF